MDIAFITEYMKPIIVGLCLVVGFLVKHCFTFVPNKFIPLIVAVLGMALAVWMDWGAITPETLLTGLVSGLASTGMHQLLKQLLNLGEE